MTHGRAENLHYRIVLRNSWKAAQGPLAIDGSALRLRYVRQQAPGAQDAVTARRILIGGLSRDADIFGIVSELAPLHPRNGTFAGEVFLRLGADALDRCGASRADPVALEG